MTAPVASSGVARARFLTFEGGEGAGKSVQAKRLASALTERGISVTLTREPGGTPGAEEIRALLVQGAHGRWTPLTELMLFAAARSDHLDRLIRPKLAEGSWVISDRFADSTLAYQSAGQGLDRDIVETANRLVVGATVPDLTFILDLPVEEGLKRADTRAAATGSTETRFESFDRAFHERLRAAFHALAEEEPQRCILVDTGRSVDVVAAEIWSHVAARFGL